MCSKCFWRRSWSWSSSFSFPYMTQKSGKKKQHKYRFLVRTSCGHARPLRPDAQGSTSFSPSPGSRKNVVQEKFSLTFWSLRKPEDSGVVRVQFRVRFQAVKVLIFAGFPLGNPLLKGTSLSEYSSERIRVPKGPCDTKNTTDSKLLRR